MPRLFSGLWTVCLNGFNDMRLQYERAFYGCGHVLLEDYDIIRNEIQPRESADELTLIAPFGNNYN